MNYQPIDSAKAALALAALAGLGLPTIGAAQVFTPNSTNAPGSYGTPYGDLGLNSTSVWEQYRKNDPTQSLNSVVGTNVSGNGTQVTYSNSNAGGNGGFSAPGVFFNRAPSQTGTVNSTSTSNQLYLGNSIQSSGGDANGHGPIDLRLGFMASPSTFVTNHGGDNAQQDLYYGNWGTQGVEMHLNVANTSATTAGQPGGNWTTSASQFYVVAPTDGPEGQRSAAATYFPGATITTGTSTTTNGGNAGALYNSPLELSWKLVQDPNNSANVDMIAKLGNTLYTQSFAATSLPNWQTATPVAFVGSQGANPASVHMGVLFPGDANADGKVNLADFGALRSNFSATDATFSQGDFNQDGKVTLADFGILRSNFGTGATAPVVKSQVVKSQIVRSAAVISAPPPPPAAGAIQLVVNTTTGDVKIDGNASSLSGYEIDSSSASLDHTKLISVASQYSSDGFGPLSSKNGQTDNVIGEGTLSSGPSLPGPDTEIDLGDIFRVGQATDLQFSALDNNSNSVEAGVKYFSSTPEPASVALISVLSIGGLMARRRRNA